MAKTTTGEPTTIDFRHFFNSLKESYIAFLPNDPIFTIIAENEAHAQIALGNAESSIGKPTFDVYPDNSEKYRATGVSDLLESFRKVIKTGKPDSMPILNYDVKGPDGKFVEKWWQVTHYPVFDAHGKLSFFYQSTTDITEEILVAQRFELAKSQLDSALAIGLVSTWTWNMLSDTVIGDANLAKSFGVKPELAASGLPLKIFTDSIHEDDRERVIKAIQKSIKNDTIYVEEYRTMDSSGNLRWVIARGKQEKDASGKAVFFLGANVDITERKQAEEELVQIKSMFNALFESKILCIAMADLSGNILQANKTFLRTFGYTKKEFDKGFTSSMITPAKSRKITEHFYETVRMYGEAEPVEKEYVRKDGTVLPMLLGAAMLPGSDNEFMAYMLDISENKELRALNIAKDEFIGMASHQLRTPATVTKQYISLLKTGFAGALNEAQQTFANKAYSSNERQLGIVNDLLKTAQIDSNRFVLNKEKIRVPDLVTRAVLEMDEPIAHRQQTVEYEDLTNEAFLYIDPIELNLILVNIIENANKYSPEGSKIYICSKIENKSVSISIRDEGVGIAKEDQKRIFQKFTRIDNELSDTVSGSGLGLYSVERILKLHGGNIQVESSPGKGSTFILCLPYEE